MAVWADELRLRVFQLLDTNKNAAWWMFLPVLADFQAVALADDIREVIERARRRVEKDSKKRDQARGWADAIRYVIMARHFAKTNLGLLPRPQLGARSIKRLLQAIDGLKADPDLRAHHFSDPSAILEVEYWPPRYVSLWNGRR